MSHVIGLIAATLTGNHGAEAMVSSVVGRLRERFPGARFVLFTYYPAADRRALGVDHLEVLSCSPLRLVIGHFPGAVIAACMPRGMRHRLRFLPVEVRRLNECSILIDLAGVSFIDGREKFLPFNVLTILPAFMLRIPVVKASQALGPFSGFLNRVAARFCLPRCAVIHARGARTNEYLLGLGLKNVTPAPDVAFLLDKGDRLVRADTAVVDAALVRIRELRQSGREIVGVCPSSVIFRKAGDVYVDTLARLIARIEQRGCAVVFVPNATRANDPEGLFNNDLPVIRRLLERLDGLASTGERVVIDCDIDAVSIKDVIDACDVMIVSRFHAMIGALSLAKPTLVFGWSHKYAEVMKEFGAEDLVFDYAGLSIDDVFPKVASLIARHEAASAEIARALPAIRARAMVQIEAMAALLETRH